MAANLDAFKADPAAMPPECGHWARAHNLALVEPSGPDERRLVRLLRTVTDLHGALKDDISGPQSVLAPLLKAAGAYLAHPHGRIDGNTVYKALRQLAESAGLDPEAI